MEYSIQSKIERKSFSWKWSDLSLWFLLFSNVLTIYFAITENWNLLTIMWIYWFQSIIIGFFNFIRILQLKEFSTKGFKINGRPVKATKETKIFAAFFFLMHYGFFHFGYMVFLLTFTAIYKEANYFGNVKYIILMAIVFFINHLFSYVYNKSRDKEKKNIVYLMIYPYLRIIPMHLTIIFGFFSNNAIILFLLLKTFADVMMHIIEHNVYSIRRNKYN